MIWKSHCNRFCILAYSLVWQKNFEGLSRPTEPYAFSLGLSDRTIYIQCCPQLSVVASVKLLPSLWMMPHIISASPRAISTHPFPIPVPTFSLFHRKRHYIELLKVKGKLPITLSAERATFETRERERLLTKAIGVCQNSLQRTFRKPFTNS